MENIKYAKPIDDNYTCLNRQFLSKLLEDKPHLTKDSYRVLFYMLANMNETEPFKIGSFTKIAKECNVCVAAVSRGIIGLVEDGIFIREDTHSFRFNPECLK
jgi:hypothetical protein